MIAGIDQVTRSFIMDVVHWNLQVPQPKL